MKGGRLRYGEKIELATVILVHQSSIEEWSAKRIQVVSESGSM